MATEVEVMVEDLLKRMRENGIDAKVTYCISDSKIVSFEIEIVGYLE